MKNRLLGVALLVVLPFGLSTRLAAADQPEPGVARVSVIHGDVSTMRGDSGDWVAAAVNAPLVRGDKVSTGDQSRAEIELDYANILRLDERAEANLADLTRTRILVQVARGTTSFAVAKGSEAEVEIDTPNVAVHPLGEGSYRVQVISDDQTDVIVRKGEADVSTPQGTTRVEKGQIIHIRGTQNPEYQVSAAPPRDEWDQWNRERDHVIARAASWRYANRYYTGMQDLDAYGRWVSDPGLGSVWAPYEPVDWVPYRDGRWVWEPYWGWTWASYEPWGWAPYHYGRWCPWNGGWAWWPGFATFNAVPVWAPAWVSFIGFGFGHHFGFGFGFGTGFGSIGWCPLGPADPFFPWWGQFNSFNTVNITNITNVTNITNISNVGDGRHVHILPGTAALANRGQFSNLSRVLTDPHVHGAVTAVPVGDFVSGRIPRHGKPVDVAMLRQGQVVSGTLPVVPTRDSLRPVDRPATAAVATTGQHFFTRSPRPAPPESFTERAAGIQAMIQNRGAGAMVAPEKSPSRSPAGVPSEQIARSWQRFGSNGGAAPARPAQVEPTPAASGRRFGGLTTRAAVPPRANMRSGQTGESWRRFEPAPRSVPSEGRSAAPPKVQNGWRGQEGWDRAAPRGENPRPQAGPPVQPRRDVSPREMSPPASSWRPPVYREAPRTFEPRTYEAPRQSFSSPPIRSYGGGSFRAAPSSGGNRGGGRSEGSVNRHSWR